MSTLDDDSAKWSSAPKTIAVVFKVPEGCFQPKPVNWSNSDQVTELVTNVLPECY